MSYSFGPWVPTTVTVTSASQVSVTRWDDEAVTLASPVTVVNGAISFAVTAPDRYRIEVSVPPATESNTVSLFDDLEGTSSKSYTDFKIQQLVDGGAGASELPAGGTNGQVLKVVGGVPAWAADTDTNTTYPTLAAAAATAGTATTASTITAKVLADAILERAELPTGGTAGQVLKRTGAGTGLAWQADTNTTYVAATTAALGLVKQGTAQVNSVAATGDAVPLADFNALLAKLRTAGIIAP